MPWYRNRTLRGSSIQASSRYSWHSKNSLRLNSSMPRRTRSGRPSGRSVPGSLPAAAAPAAAAPAAATSRDAGIHHRVRGHRRGAGGNRGEVGDHAPRLYGAALGTLGRVVGGAHRAHKVEALVAVRTLVLVEGHPVHLSSG